MKFKLNFFQSYISAPGEEYKRYRFLIFISSILFILINAYLLYIPETRTITDDQMKVGDIVKQDIIIKKNINIEDKESTQEKVDRAIKNVIPNYEFHPDRLNESMERLNAWLEYSKNIDPSIMKKRSTLLKLRGEVEEQFGIELSSFQTRFMLESKIFSRLDPQKLTDYLEIVYRNRIIGSKLGAKKSPGNEIKLVLKNTEPLILKVDELYDLKKVDTLLAQYLKTENFKQKEIQLITSVLMEFLNANISFSLNLTQGEEKRVSSQVLPVLINLKAGKVIRRKGDELRPEDLKIIRLITSEEDKRQKGPSDFVLILAILAILTMFGRKIFRTWKISNINRKKILVVTAATLTLSAVIYRISLFLLPLILKNLSIPIEYDINSIYYAVPFAFGGLIFSFIFDLQSAVVFSFFNALGAGILCQWNFKISLYALVGNLAVSYGIEFYQRLKRSPIFKAGLSWLLLANILIIFLFHTIEHYTLDYSLVINLLMGCLSAILAPILASFIIPLWETLFKLITELKLIELTNLNLPIFREMLEKAPGTYHHSQMVASLSETAAQSLNISPLLLTAMALYHDIGKIDNPEMYTENHSIYPNPHEKMSPLESARNIISHLPNGLERAEKLKLPESIKSSINQHHGTKVLRFFFDKALEMSTVDRDEMNDKAFRYQGDKPQNIENAVIMLADQVEAASKSLASPSDEDIQNIIDKIIHSNIEEEQFSDCEGLTFKSLNIIAQSFYKKLTSIYHMRIAYPGFDFKENGNNGTNNQQQVQNK